MPLQSSYNRAGIYTDGSQFGSAAGIDDDGTALSATLLGPSETWHSTFFDFGLPNATNVISATGQTITLPPGQYSSLLMLAVGVNGSQDNQAFTVNYTNGAASSFSVSIADWVVPVNYSGQTTVETIGHRNTSSGSQDNPGANIYGYTMTLNSNYVVKSIKLPNNANVEVLALSLSNYTAAIPELPVIVSQPQSVITPAGSTAAFFVTAQGSPTLTYQWQKDGAGLTDGGNIAGSESATLNLTTVGTNDIGSYDVIVSNSYGSVTSSIVTLNVGFYFQTAAQTVEGGSNAVTFSWQTTPGLSYQVQYTPRSDVHQLDKSRPSNHRHQRRDKRLRQPRPLPATLLSNHTRTAVKSETEDVCRYHAYPVD